MNERFDRTGEIARVDLAYEPDFALGGIDVRPSRRELSGEGWRETQDPRVMRVPVALAREGRSRFARRSDRELLGRRDRRRGRDQQLRQPAAFTRIVWLDDGQIEDLHIVKDFDKKTPRVKLSVSERHRGDTAFTRG
jgi:hypothetical protein